MDLRGRQALLEENDDVPGYVRFHIEELDDDAAVHAKPPESFSVVLDYSIGRAHTDRILGVTFAPKGQVVEVSHDS